MFIQLKNLLNEILNEIGEGSSKPFEHSRKREGKYIIHGVTSKGEEVDIELTVIAPIEGNSIGGLSDNGPISDMDGMYVSFEIQSINGKKPDETYSEIGDSKYMFRLMATLKEILLPIIQKENIEFITYSPIHKVLGAKVSTNTPHTTDEGRGRDILYKLFIKKQFPNSEPYKGVSGSVRLILLNR